MYAAKEDDIEKLEFLIENGADVNKPLDNFTVLQYAMDNSKKGCFEKAAREPSPVRHDTDYTQLMLAARMNDVKWAKELINSGEDVNAATQEGKTAMKLAVMNDSAECCKVLIDNGVDITNVNDYLRLALDHSSVRCTRLFLDKGANVNEQAENVTPLVLAIKQNDNEWAKDLLERGADVNAKVMYVQMYMQFMQKTPLMFAAERQNLNFVQLLIDHGADVNMKTHEHGETVLDKIIEASTFSIHDVERRKRLREIYCVLVAHGARCANTTTDENVRAMDPAHFIEPPSLQRQARDSIYTLTKGMTGVSYSAVIDSLIKDGYLPAKLKPFMM
ncbi:unnamed protein product, partial [Owenia fusiformis]